MLGGILEAGSLTGATTAAGAGIGVGGLGGGSHREATAVQVQGVCHVGQAPQASKLAVHLLHLSLHLHEPKV